MYDLPKPLNVLVNHRLEQPVIDAAKALGEVRVTQARQDSDEYAEALPDAHVIFGNPGLERLKRAGNLIWLQTTGAGVAGLAKDLPGHITLTNGRGIYAIPMAEHILGMMVAMVRGFPQLIEAQLNREWRNSGIHREELFGRTCGIVGVGSIGGEVAKRASAFGMRIVGCRRHPEQPCPHVDEMFGHDQLGDLLDQSDHVINALPGTDDTHHLFDASTFSRFKTGSYFYNVGRGSTVDEVALVDALESGQLAGAGLDVFETEPLPEDSPLWSMSNVMITPHRSGDSPADFHRLGELFLDNLQRFIAGTPLRNQVDRGLQY